MPIKLSCRKCGEEYRVSDSRAGASFKCRECGAPNQVPTPGNPSPSKRSSSRQGSKRSARRQEFDDDYDDYEMEYEEYESPASGNRPRQRRGRSEVTDSSLPILQYSITGSIIIAVYFVVYMVLDTALATATVNDWGLPEAQKNSLGSEVAILQYGIRPPAGLTFAGHKDNGIHRDWAWECNGQSMTVSVRSNPRIAQHGLTEPEIHTTTESFQSSRPEGDQPYVLDGGTVEHGTIDGVKFTRARWDMQGGTMFMGPAVTSSYRYFTDYITYDGINRIDVVFSSRQQLSSTDATNLEASAFTLRRLPANSNVTPPALAPNDTPTESSTVPARNVAEVVKQPISPNVQRVTSTAATESERNPSAQTAVSGTPTRRVNSNSSIAQASQAAKLNGKTPTVVSVATAPYVGTDGIGIRVPSSCIVDQVKSSDSGFSFAIRVPGDSPGVMNVSIRKNATYTADHPVKVVTETGPVRISFRGTVIMAQGGTVTRNLIDGINCRIIENHRPDGFEGQMFGYDTGFNVDIRWISKPEVSQLVMVMEAMARTFTRSARDAKLPGNSRFGTQVVSSSPAPARTEPRNVPPKVTRPAALKSQTDSAVTWGNNSGTNIPIKNWSTALTYSPAPSKYVAVENTIFDLSSGSPVLALPDYTFRAAAFSPSGARYAIVNTRGSDWEGNVVVHSVVQPDAEAIELVLDDRPYRYEVLRFLSESRLFVYGRSGGDRTAAIWDLDSLQVERRLPIQPGDQGSFAVSSDGAFIATASATELKVFSTKTGQEVAQMEKPTKTVGLSFCNGLAFSPDMQELAALTMGKHVTVWSNRGKVVFECELSEKLAAHIKNEQGIIWMPDSSGWLLQGKFLLLRDGPTEGWWLKSERPYDAVPGTLTADNRAIGAKGSASGGLLTAVEIPISAIRATVDAANKVPPLLSEGDSVSLDLTIESLRFATDVEARTALTEAFAARLKRGNIGISDGSKVSLQVRYFETQGKERRIVKGPFAVFTQEEGIKAQDTNCAVEMALVSSERSEPLWSNKIDSDAGILIDEEPNDKGLRNSAFGSILNRIKQLDLPLRVSGDPNASLPVITRP